MRGVYDKAGPRLKSRNRLRHMVESVDRFGIEHTCLEVLEIQKLQPGFAESELRAAKAMLRLLEFDAELNPAEAEEEESAGTGVGAALRSYSEEDEGEVRTSEISALLVCACTRPLPAVCEILRSHCDPGVKAFGRLPCKHSLTSPQPNYFQTAEETVDATAETVLWGRKVLTVPTYPKLGREVRAVCHAILTARNPATLNAEKRKLLEMAGSVERLYDIIRYYKVRRPVYKCMSMNGALCV